MGAPYNPLDKLNLGRSVAEALLLAPVLPLGEIPDLPGAGVYAIYYSGDFEPYRAIVAKSPRRSRLPWIGRFGKRSAAMRQLTRGVRPMRK